MFRTLTVVFLSGALTLPLGAATPSTAERLVIPLSDATRPAHLEVGLIMGSITVVPGKTGEVVIVADVRADEERHRHRAREPRGDREGMHRIPNTSLGLEAEEKGNRVEVGVNSWASSVDLRIEVPPASSVELSTINGGDLSVEGLSGELVLHNTNGGITVRDVRGPVDASTVNGDVRVVFGAEMASAPMAFSTLNGDIDLTLPANAHVDVQLRSDNGEILSDFEVALRRGPARVETGEKKGTYRISVAQALSGKIGGGGPELFLKTFNGDILLRRPGR